MLWYDIKRMTRSMLTNSFALFSQKWLSESTPGQFVEELYPVRVWVDEAHSHAALENVSQLGRDLFGPDNPGPHAERAIGKSEFDLDRGAGLENVIGLDEQARRR